MDSISKKEVDRVKRAISYISKKLGTKYIVQVYPVADKEGEETADSNVKIVANEEGEENIILQVCRSNRGQQDKSVFLVFVDPNMTRNRSRGDLLRHVFHELCHMISWDYTDEMENILKHIPDSPLKEELYDRMYNVREDVTYRLERTFGPHVLPSLDWTKL